MIQKLKSILNDVWNTYSSPNRHYHNLDHINECLGLFNQYRDHVENPLEFATAIIFHDYVYDIHSSTNEERSADCAVQITAPFFYRRSQDIIHDLIIATKHNKKGLSGDRALIADIDLYRLSVPYEKFQKHSEQIRKEYETIPLTSYINGRIDFFKSLIDRRRIFQSDIFKTSEYYARSNILRAIKEMENEQKTTRPLSSNRGNYPRNPIQ